ncbi:MAG: hypothetical protein R2932_05115 [Caldilineaceae bacterium]
MRELVLGSLPYTVTLRMDNPSHQAFNWEATLLSGQSFVEFHEAISNTATGTLRYGDPVYLTLTISPTQLLTGSHAATLQIDAIKADNTRLTHFVDLSVLMRPPGNLLLYYFPLVLYGDRTSVSTTDYQWETPVEPNDRVVHGMANNSNIGIALPFPFTLRNREYEDARLYSDGFLRFPDTSVGNNLPNRCLPNLSEPAQAIYGWWADLDPSAQNARVSTFQPTVDRFVIEFDSVPSAPGITPAYQVSFQIVLYANGDIRLNYGEALGLTPNAPDVTVGVKARDGLFFNQVACKDGAMEVGYLPQSLQSLLFKAQGDIY